MPQALNRAAALLLIACAPATRADGTADAVKALEAGFPGVALVKIERECAGIGTLQAGAEANLLYAQALIADGQFAAAAAILEKPELALGAPGKFLLARAQALNGDWRQALASTDACLADPDFPDRAEATAGRARLLSNLGDQNAAREILASARSWAASPVRSQALMDLAELELTAGESEKAAEALGQFEPAGAREKSRRNFLLARVASLHGDHENCLALLEGLQPLDPRMDARTAILSARSLSALGRTPGAEARLEEFVSARGDSEELGQVFEALDEISASAPGASPTELSRWADEQKPSRRKTLATYYLAKFESRRGQPAQAAELLERLAAAPGLNPLAEETSRELAAIRIRLGRHADALNLLPPAGFSAHTDFLRGLALAGLGENQAASESFLSAAKDPLLAESALFNSALCGLLRGEPANEGLARLRAEFPASPMLDAYLLQESFQLARAGDPRTLEVLRLLAESGKPGIASRARIALAEWKYRQLDTDGARLELQRASTNTDPARQAALKVFIEDKSSTHDTAIAAAREFLAAHGGSDPEAAVRMKLGELLYASGDFAAARVELESLAEKFPGSAFEEPALFLAAQSASRIPTPSAESDTLLLYESVAAKGGPLALRARLRQAEIQAALGKPGEANTILDRIISSGADRQTRAAALVEKGKNLQAMAGADPANLRAAIEAWKQVASEEASNPDWRNQALTRIGAALEKSGDLNGAVAAYYDVFQPGAATPVEFFWFYKAGFAAGRILESQEKWDEAIRTYEILRGTDGPRSLEAANRIKKLRLEHFLWDGE